MASLRVEGLDEVDETEDKECDGSTNGDCVNEVSNLWFKPLGIEALYVPTFKLTRPAIARPPITAAPVQTACPQTAPRVTHQ